MSLGSTYSGSQHKSSCCLSIHILDIFEERGRISMQAVLQFWWEEHKNFRNMVDQIAPLTEKYVYRCKWKCCQGKPVERTILFKLHYYGNIAIKFYLCITWTVTNWINLICVLILVLFLFIQRLVLSSCLCPATFGKVSRCPWCCEEWSRSS